uniref:rRNA adenine N(6)-methyltransferase n=1 Tax=Phlebotomus papatasi TaxID=29031 RepID=A0A1B0DNZ7_PHLPP
MIAIPRNPCIQFLSHYCKRTSRITILQGEKWNLQLLRLSSTAELPEKLEPERVRRKRKTKTKDSESPQEDLLTYFTSEKQRNTLGSFPRNYFNKKLNTPNHLYIADETVARNIADCVAASSSKDTPILEINPGCGILTQQLLRVTNQKIHLFESVEEFSKNLEKIVSEHLDRVSLKKEDLTALWRIAYQDKLDNGDRVQKLLDGKLPKRDWTEEPNARIVGAIGSGNFFKHLVNSLVYQSSLLTYGRCEMFLVVPPPIYIQLTCSKDAGYLLYRYMSVLFQIFFEYEFIQKVPRKAFLPWQHDYNHAKHNKLSKVNSIDADSLYLVRIAPRKEAYDLCSPDDMQALWFFVKQNMISRTNRVIPSLEKWIPYCGLRLISQKVSPMPMGQDGENPRNGELPEFVQPCRPISKSDHRQDINIFTQFGDLTPSEMLSLFQQFRNWPEYKQSPFLSLMENSLIKMFAQDQDATTEDQVGDFVEKPAAAEDDEAER